jgi:hypothetical protein
MASAGSGLPLMVAKTNWFFFSGALRNPEVLRHLLRGEVYFGNEAPKYRSATLNNFKTKFHGPLEDICKLGEDDTSLRKTERQLRNIM